MSAYVCRVCMHEQSSVVFLPCRYAVVGVVWLPCVIRLTVLCMQALVYVWTVFRAGEGLPALPHVGYQAHPGLRWLSINFVVCLHFSEVRGSFSDFDLFRSRFICFNFNDFLWVESCYIYIIIWKLEMLRPRKSTAV